MGDLDLREHFRKILNYCLFKQNQKQNNNSNNKPWSLADWWLCNNSKREENHIELGGRHWGWGTISCKPHAPCGNTQPGENSTPRAYPQGTRGWNPTLGTSTFETVTWETSPPKTNFENQSGSRPETHKTVVMWEMALWSLAVLTCPGMQHTGRQPGPDLKWRRITCLH